MSKRACILAAFLGLLIGGAVWLWPQGPIWVSEAGAGRIVGFSSDRKVLLTCSDSERVEQQVSRWEVETGRLLSRAAMEGAQPQAILDLCAVRPSPSSNVALVGEGVQDVALSELITGSWFLHDATTGRRVRGPLAGVKHVSSQDPFSQDGRWFAAYRGDPTSGARAYHALGIYSAQTGDCVIDVSAEPGGLATCRFAPDGRSAAVCLTPKDSKADDRWLVVRLFELPSGRLLRHAEIRCSAPLWVHDWDGRHLGVIKTSHEGRQRVVYDLSEDPLPTGRPDPVIRDQVNAVGSKVHFHWQVGHDWAAFFIDVPNTRRPGITGWLDWLAERIDGQRKGRNSEVRIVDRATGVTRFELPRPVARNLVFSADGKRLACPTGRADSFEVWDLDPPPRWPFALASGSVAAAMLLALGKWRRHRAVKNAAQTVGA